MIGIILASGESKRMNRNKLLLDYKGETIIENVIRKVKEANLEEVVVVCRDNDVKNIAIRLGVKVIINTKFIFGQSESIKIAIDSIEDNKDYMFFVGDIPLITTKTINNMIKKFDEVNGIVVARIKDKISNPAIFSSRFKSDLLALQGDMGGRVIIKSYTEVVTYYDIKDEKEIFDIDTKEDYDTLLKLT